MRKIKHRLAGLRNAVSQTRAAASGQTEPQSRSEEGDNKNRDVFRKSSTTSTDSRPDWYQAIHGSDS